MPQPVAHVDFGVLNYAMLALYFCAMLAVGAWASRRVRSSAGYFVAEGKLGAVVVGMSLLGTYLSALTMMGLPGKAFGPDDLTYSIQLPFLLVTAVVITRFVLPKYRAAGSISVYELLERRIHVSCRLVASASFILFSIARMGVILYLPALAMSNVAGVPLQRSIVAMGIIMTIYTVAGGIEAVIYTEAAQVLVFIAAAVVSLAYVLVHTAGGQFGAVVSDPQYHKLRVMAPGYSLYKATSFWLVAETLFSTIRIYGTQQCFTQRFMTTSSTKKAIQSVWISILGYIPLAYLFYFMGTALFVYYHVHPDPNLPKGDAIYPYFVVTCLPPGIAGLVIAGIFAAAMSAVSSLMNANSTACVEDWYRRFATVERPDRHYLRVARWLSLLWGVLAVVMALAFQHTKSVVDLWIQIMGIACNGILGFMALAFLPFKVRPWAALCGFGASWLALAVMLACGTSQFTWAVLGNLTCFGVALVLHLLAILWQSACMEDQGGVHQQSEGGVVERPS
jgi:SSS family transporter